MKDEWEFIRWRSKGLFQPEVILGGERELGVVGVRVARFQSSGGEEFGDMVC